MAKGILSDDNSLNAGPQESKLPAGHMRMSPADRLRMTSIMELRDEAEAKLLELQTEIQDQVLEESTLSVLAGQKVQSEMAAQAQAQLRAAEGRWNQIAKSAFDQVVEEAKQIPNTVIDAGMQLELPPWEREIYDSLPRDVAHRVATQLRNDPTMTEADLTSIAAVAALSDGMVIPDPKLPPLNPNPIPVNYPTPATPPLSVRCPKPDPMPECDAYGPAGWCRKPNGEEVLMGEMPLISGGGPDVPPLLDYELIAYRGMWAASVIYAGDRLGWQVGGVNSNYPRCAEVTPQTPPGPPPPPTCYFLTRDEYIASLGPPPQGFRFCINSTTDPAGCVIWGFTAVLYSEPCPGEHTESTPLPTCPELPPDTPNCPIILAPGTIVIVPTMGPSGPYYPYMPSLPPPPPVPPPGTGIGTPVSEEVPPVPPPPPGPVATVPPPILPYTNPAFLYDDPKKVCDQLKVMTALAGVSGVATQVEGTAGQIGNLFVGVWNSVFSWVSSVTGSRNNATIEAFKTIEELQNAAAKKAIEAKMDAGDCTKSSYIDLAARVGNAANLEARTGVPLTYFEQDTIYAMQFLCPKYLPGQGDLNKLYLSDTITDIAWTCYTKALGNLPNLQRKLRDLDRTKPDLRDVIKLHEGDEIGDADYVKRLHELGVVDADDRDAIIKAWKYTPTPSDLVEFMQKDVAVEEFVLAGNLDDGFTDSFSKQFRTWAKANGVSEEIMKYHYRASWVFPSNTAIYEMYHRLRPGRVDPKLALDTNQAKQVLKINDVAPGFQDRILAISDLLPNQTTLKHGYFLDALNYDEVYESLLDLGYGEDGAELVMKVYDEDKRHYLRNKAAHQSAWSPKTITTAYANGELNEREAIQLLRDINVDNDAINPIMESAFALMKAKSRRKCLHSLKNKYMKGAIGYYEAYDGLSSIIGDQDQAQVMMEQWQCEFSNKAIEVGGAINVRLFKKGIISRDELGNRLLRLGYTELNAGEFIAEAIRDLTIAALKAAAKAAKEARSERERLRKEIEKKQKELAKQMAAAAATTNQASSQSSGGGGN